MQIWLWVDVVELDEIVAFIQAEVAPVISVCVDAVHDGILNAGMRNFNEFYTIR